MASTLIQPDHPHPTSSASKLPIKRKTPDPNPPPPDAAADGGAPPFKFHRIWTEPDEIRFLEGLLDCSSQNLAFPRDLGIFYARFSNTMSQPYTKSQLSEKLRRLRKKFRVISTRLSRGLDRSQLSAHDRGLYDLSKRLWHPEFAATSPFSGARNVGLTNQSNGVGGGGGGDGVVKRSSLVGVRVDFSPTLPVRLCGFDQESDGNDANLELDCAGNENGGDGEGGARFGDFYHNNDDEVMLSEVNVEFEGELEDKGDDAFGGGFRSNEQNVDLSCDNGVRGVAAKVVISVFDECFKEVRRLLGSGGGERVGGAGSFQMRWQQQRIAELDVLGSRLRLVLEHSLRKH